MDDDRPCFLSESYISDHFESIDMQIKKIRKKPHFSCPQNGVLLYGRIDLFLNCRIVSYLGILLSNSPAVKKRGELPATSRTSRQAQSSRIFFRIFMWPTIIIIKTLFLYLLFLWVFKENSNDALMGKLKISLFGLMENVISLYQVFHLFHKNLVKTCKDYCEQTRRMCLSLILFTMSR